MSEDSKIDIGSDDWSDSTDGSFEKTNQLMSSLISEESKIQSNIGSDIVRWFNIFENIDQIDHVKNEHFAQSNSESEEQPDNCLNLVLDQLANENLPDIFRETTSLIKNKLTGEVVNSMILSGFYKNMLVNEIKQLKSDSHYQSDQDLKEGNIITEEDEIILWKYACLPKPSLLSKLNQSQRNLVSSVYKIISDSNFAYNKWLRYALPLQYADWELEKRIAM